MADSAASRRCWCEVRAASSLTTASGKVSWNVVTPCVSKPAEVRSAVSFKTGEYTPDFHAFETDNFIILPWDREIIQNGEIIVRPDYASRL